MERVWSTIKEIFSPEAINRNQIICVFFFYCSLIEVKRIIFFNNNFQSKQGQIYIKSLLNNLPFGKAANRITQRIQFNISQVFWLIVLLSLNQISNYKSRFVCIMLWIPIYSNCMCTLQIHVSDCVLGFWKNSIHIHNMKTHIFFKW